MKETNKMLGNLLKEEKIEIKEMSIIFDRKQYSIRIPKDFAETINKNVGKLNEMKFKFTLTTPSGTSSSKPKLTGELIYE